VHLAAAAAAALLAPAAAGSVKSCPGAALHPADSALLSPPGSRRSAMYSDTATGLKALMLHPTIASAAPVHTKLYRTTRCHLCFRLSKQLQDLWVVMNCFVEAIVVCRYHIVHQAIYSDELLPQLQTEQTCMSSEVD
jgi:hypothetical protein